MANQNKPISALTAVTTLDGTETLPVVQGGVTKRATAAQILGTGTGNYVTYDGTNLRQGGSIVPISGTGGGDTSKIKSDITRIYTVGDSITYGNQDASGVSYPGTLAGLLTSGITVVNHGHPGWTTTDLAVEVGATPVTVAAFTLAGDTTTATPVTVLSPTVYFSGAATSFTGNLTAGGTTYPVALTLTGGVWAIRRTITGAATPIPSGAVFRANAYDSIRDAVQIIEGGRNNFDVHPETVVPDIAALAANLTPTVPRYLVLSMHNKNDEGVGTTAYTTLIGINAALAAAHGDRYVDTRAYLISNGLAYNGLTATNTDLTAIAQDRIPPQLLYTDGVHPNQYGYKAMAYVIQQRLNQLDWLRGTRTITATSVPYAATTVDATLTSLLARVAALESGLPLLTNTSLPTITGTLAIGATLTTTDGTWAYTPSGTTYQWNRNGTPISGATGNTYTTVTADGGTNITVTVTASKGGYTPNSATSNAVAIPAPAFNPATLSSPLYVWYDAQMQTTTDGAVVAGLTDQTTNGINATTSTGGNITYSATALNGKPAWIFGSGGRTVKDTATFPAISGTITMFIVAQLTSQAGDKNFVSGISAGAGYMKVFALSGTTWAVSRGNAVTAGAATVDLNPHIIRASVDGAGNAVMAVNGTQVISAAGAGTLQPTAFRIGADQTGFSPMAGPLSAVLIFKGALTSTEITNVESWLHDRWGFTY